MLRTGDTTASNDYADEQNIGCTAFWSSFYKFASSLAICRLSTRIMFTNTTQHRGSRIHLSISLATLDPTGAAASSEMPVFPVYMSMSEHPLLEAESDRLTAN
jgi:hypothetical protein